MARWVLRQPSTMTRRGRPSSKRGFTLVELSIVVVIVGVLAVVAVAGYRRMILSSKITEAQNMVNAIKIAQEDYKTERGLYAAITTYCPSGAGVHDKKFGWDSQCGAPNRWEVLPVHADNAVQFAYASPAGPSNFTAPGDIGCTIDWSGAMADTTRPWYVVHAKADLDEGGVATELVSSSFQNTVFSCNEGE
jgi:type IV pilus assembly protein PilA